MADWFEAGLAVTAFILPPLLVLASRGAAPLAGFAGLCAAGVVARRPPRRLSGLWHPAILLGLLIGWGALSAAWSIIPGHSLILAARLFGLAISGVALAAAAPRVARPQRIAALLLAGTALGIALLGVDLATGGALTRLLHARPYRPAALNQVAVALAILAMPVGAALLCRGRAALGVAAAIVMAAAVALSFDTTSKAALVLGVAIAALVLSRRGAAVRALAIASMLAIIVAPLVLPRLVEVPGLFHTVDSFKESAGHRLLIWWFVGNHIAERPIAGWGLDASRAIPGGNVLIRPTETWLPLHPHDAALQIWLELGAPGAALAALFVALLWRRLADADWPRLYAAAAGGGFAAALAIAFAAYGIWEEWWLGTLALALFLVLVMGRVARLPRPTRPPPRGRRASYRWRRAGASAGGSPSA